MGQVRKQETDLLLLDRRLGRPACMEVARAVRSIAVGTGLVLLVAEPDTAEAWTFFDAGVGGYVSKDVTGGHLLAAMQAVAAGRRQVLAITSWPAAARRSGAASPTPQERQVLHLVAAGKATKEIAGYLYQVVD